MYYNEPPLAACCLPRRRRRRRHVDLFIEQPMAAYRLSMSRDFPHVATVVSRVSESIIESPPIIIVLGCMSMRLVMHLACVEITVL
jgi:hypothetical protein